MLGTTRRRARWLFIGAVAAVLWAATGAPIDARPVVPGATDVSIERVAAGAAQATHAARARIDELAETGARWGEFTDPTDALVVVRQPDGTTFKAAMTPVETGGALEVEGYSVTKGDDGWWRYAEGRGADGLEPSAAVVGVDAAPSTVERGVGRVDDVWSDPSGTDTRAEILRQLQIASRAAQAQATAAGEPRVFRFPVVLFATWYDEEGGQSAPQFQDGNGVEHYEAILDGFGGNPTGTLTEFYFENSYGQFLVQVDVLAKPDGSPYVSNRSSLPKTTPQEGNCYYGGIDPPADPADDLDPLDSVVGAGGGGALGMAVEAMNTTTLPVDHDFSPYDNDGDGSVDFMGIIHSGPEMAVSGDPCHTWSHALSVSTFTSLAGEILGDMGLTVPADLSAGLPVPGQPGMTYDRLFTMPEFETQHGVLTIGVAAHEMAHALGEPDYYGTNGSSSGSGDWDVMSGGSYGGTPSGSNPTWFNPASRVFQGWVTPTVVHDDARDVELARRSSQPPGYTADQPNPNLVLVPTRWVHVGDTTPLDETDDESVEHTWTADDVHGLVQDGDNGYVIEGFYLEYAGRMPLRADGIHPEMTRESYFDRWLYGSGLLTWHFDYWRRSNVLNGDNGGNDDPNRLQMDVEEWDRNDNTQEIALNQNRAEATDVAWDAATGITSGTHRNNPVFDIPGGLEPQAGEEIPLGGPVTPGTPYDHSFEVDDNPANLLMRVTASGLGDCTLQLLHEGEPASEVVDSGFVGTAEEVIITEPDPGTWTARVGDFAACGFASGTVEFVGPSGFDSTGTADTWSNWDQAPTGWAFTNIRTGPSEGLSHASDAGGQGTLTLDIVDLHDAVDVSPGFARPVEDVDTDGRSPIVAGTANAFSVPVFSNGSEDVDSVSVEVRLGSATGPVVASGEVSPGGYGAEPFEFDFDPAGEGGFDLFTIVDADDEVDEAHEGNNVQKSTGWAGPGSPSVLIVDDDGPGDTELVVAGSLAALGIPYAIAERHVSSEQMAGYEAVIWVSTLDRMEGQLDAADRGAIADYLGGGGKLWLSSNRAIEALTVTENVDFGASWFGVESIDIDSFYDPVQFATEDIFGDGDVTLEVMPGRPFVDKYALADGVSGTATGLGVLSGSGTPGDGEALLGARVEGDADGTPFQTVVTSFSMSQVADPSDAIDMVGAVMSHFGVDGGQYAVSTDDPIVYHSQLRQTESNVALPVRAIVLGGTADQPVTLFWRHHGIGDYVAMPMTPSGARGGYIATIPASEVSPDGIDYYIRAGAGSTFEPRAAAGGEVAHAVAVFMPEAAAR